MKQWEIPVPKKIERIAGLDSRLSEVTDLAERIAREGRLDSVKLSCHEGPNMRFTGVQIYGWEGNTNREGRWLTLALFAVHGGQWVAASSWCSNNPDETDITRARVVETVRDVMAVWGWQNSAKIAAKELRWDVTEYVGSAG